MIQLPVPTWVAVAILLYIGAEYFSYVRFGCFLGGKLYRSIRSARNGTLYVKIPFSWQVFIANERIRVGSEIVAAYEHEIEDAEVVRFAIPPTHVKQPPGTILVIESIGAKLMEVRRKSA